jgi:hypothetical protein
MNGVVSALIIALCFIFVFFWAPVVGVFFNGSLESAQPLTMADNSVNAGYVTGYAASLGKISDTELSISYPDAQKMGAFLNNDMSLDIDKITVNFVSPSGSETLMQKTGHPLTKPGWTVVNKKGILPIQYADHDTLLEPYESFEILVYPSTPLPPMSRFLIVIQLPDENKIFLSRSVPATISPIMHLN